MRPERKVSVTPWGIESATFRFVAQCLSQMNHRKRSQYAQKSTQISIKSVRSCCPLLTKTVSFVPIPNVKEIHSNATIFTRRLTGVNLNYFSKLHPNILSGLSSSGVSSQYSVCISCLSQSLPTSSSLI